MFQTIFMVNFIPFDSVGKQMERIALGFLGAVTKWLKQIDNQHTFSYLLLLNDAYKENIKVLLGRSSVNRQNYEIV